MEDLTMIVDDLGEEYEIQRHQGLQNSIKNGL